MKDFFADASWLADLPRDYVEPWVLDSLWTRSGFNMIVGAPKARKSFFRRYLMACAMSGTPALGKFECRDTVANALVCFGEGPKESESAAIYHVSTALGVDKADRRIQLVKPFGFHLDQPQHVTDLIAHLKGEDMKLVVFDPLLYFHGQDENDASGMGLVAAGLIRLADYACVVVVHHSGKAQPGMPERPVAHEGRGSSVLGGAAETTIAFSRVGVTNTHKARFMTRGGQEPEDLALTFDPTTGIFTCGDQELDKAILNCLEKEPDCTASRIAQLIGRRKDTVLDRLKTLRGTDFPGNFAPQSSQILQFPQREPSQNPTPLTVPAPLDPREPSKLSP